MGPFCFLGFPALFVFCWGLRPVLGRVFHPAPPKKWFSPSLRRVRVQSGRIPCHQTFFAAGGRGVQSGTTSNVIAREAEPDQLCVPASDTMSFWPAVSLAVSASCCFCSVFDSTGKPSVLRAETHRTRDLSVVLETHQLCSRLISCTRMISTLPWELTCVVCSIGIGSAWWGSQGIPSR